MAQQSTLRGLWPVLLISTGVVVTIALVGRAVTENGSVFVQAGEGEHECRCPNCGATKVIPYGQYCSEQVCPICGIKMRPADFEEVVSR